MLLSAKCSILNCIQPDISGNVVNLFVCNITVSTFLNSPRGGNISKSL